MNELTLLRELQRSACQHNQYAKWLGLYLEHADHVIEMSRQAQQVLAPPSVQIHCRAQLVAVRTLAPLLLYASQTLYANNQCIVAQQHLSLLCEYWAQQCSQLHTLASELTLQAAAAGLKLPDGPITNAMLLRETPFAPVELPPSAGKLDFYKING